MSENIALTEASFYILLSLVNPQHGYGIMQSVDSMSMGRVKLAAGTLYGALTTMCDKQWIVQLPVLDGSRKKEYLITEKGKIVLEKEISRLKELINNAIEVYEGGVSND